MAYIWIPYDSFISSWSVDCGSLDWIEENIGIIGITWIAETGVTAMNKELYKIKEKPLPLEAYDEYYGDEACALFWFKKDEAAVAFKLRWL